MFAVAGDPHVSVRRSPGGYEVTVWAGDELAAWGSTGDQRDIVHTMQGWQDGASARDLCQRSGYLVAATAATAVESLWQLLIRHGEPYLRPIVAAAAADPILRALRPWVSHGTLHLLCPSDPVGYARHGMAFHPAGQDTFMVNVCDRPLGPAEDLARAVARAAEAARSWYRTTPAYICRRSLVTLGGGLRDPLRHCSRGLLGNGDLQQRPCHGRSCGVPRAGRRRTVRRAGDSPVGRGVRRRRRSRRRPRLLAALIGRSLMSEQTACALVGDRRFVLAGRQAPRWGHDRGGPRRAIGTGRSSAGRPEPARMRYRVGRSGVAQVPDHPPDGRY